MSGKPDSIGGKRWTEVKKAESYGKVLYALFLFCFSLVATRKNVVFRYSAMEGK